MGAAEAAKEELDEFQEGSRELEAELETQLEQAEIKTKDLKALTNRLQLENEQLRDKLEQCSRDLKAAQASLLEEPPSSGPGFIRVRSGPPLGRRPASSDPVALHQEYRRHWAKANIPGERRHDRLRWAVRGWMMGEEPL